ncbi:MAG: hypothetical protein AB1Z98_33550 [Nannocystaceae bacterium]
MAREVTLVDAGLGNLASVERALIQVGAGVRVTSDPDKVATSRMVVFPGQSAFGAVTQAIVDGAMGAALKMVIERGDPFLGICLGMQLLFDGSDENGGQEGLHVMAGRCRRFPVDQQEEAEPGAVEHNPEPAKAHPEDVAPAQSMANESVILGELSRPESPAPAVVPAPPAWGGAEGSAAPAPLMRKVKVPHMGWNEVEPTGSHYYFVHSYYVEAANSEDVMWMTRYGGIRFPAAVRRGNVLGCQFHPEKSQRAGLRFLRAFLLGGWG